MSRAVDAAVLIIVVALWVLGMVLAKGFWSTAAAFLFPPWGWYLIPEACLKYIGWV